MARKFTKLSIEILDFVSQNDGISYSELYHSRFSKVSRKDFYNNIFRLINLSLLESKFSGKDKCLFVSEDGLRLLKLYVPKRDGVWKIIIFDISEKQSYVRAVLRAKLKSLNFKKWQNSIWVSPFELDQTLEKEIEALSKKYFIRLIKTTQINYTADLEKLFP